MKTSAVMAVIDGTIGTRLNLAAKETCNICGERMTADGMRPLPLPRGGVNYLHRTYVSAGMYGIPIILYKYVLYTCTCKNHLQGGAAFSPREGRSILEVIKTHPLWRDECINWATSVR